MIYHRTKLGPACMHHTVETQIEAAMKYAAQVQTRIIQLQPADQQTHAIAAQVLQRWAHDSRNADNRSVFHLVRPPDPQTKDETYLVELFHYQPKEPNR